MKKSELYHLFTEFYWLNSREPESVAEFCAFAKIEPDTFKSFFDSIQFIQPSIYLHVFEMAWEKVEIAAQENDYSPREIALALFFTLIEEFQPFKTYLNSRMGKNDIRKELDSWRGFNHQFVAKTNALQSDERLLWIRDKIPDKLTDEVNGLLLGWNYVYRVWLADDSENNTRTDAAIEKVIHLYFDLAKTDKLGQLVDFGKFLATTKLRW